MEHGVSLKVKLAETITATLVLLLLMPTLSATKGVVFEELWAQLDRESYSAYVHCTAISSEVLYVVGNKTVPEGKSVGFKHYLRVEMRERGTGILLSYWEEEARVTSSRCILRGSTLYVAGVFQRPDLTRSVGFLMALSSNLTLLKKALLDYGVESGVLAVEADGERVYVTTYVRTGNNVEYRLEVVDPAELKVVKGVNLPHEGNAVRLNPVTRHLWVLGYNRTTLFNEDLNTLIAFNVGGLTVDFSEGGYAYIVRSDSLAKVSPEGLVIKEAPKREGPGKLLDICYMDGYIFAVNRVQKYPVTGYHYYYVEAYSGDLELAGSSPLRSARGTEVYLEPGELACSGGVLYFAGWYQYAQFTGWAILALKPVEFENLTSTFTASPEAPTTKPPVTTSYTELTTQQPRITLTPQASQVGRPARTPRYWWVGLAVTLIVFTIIVGPSLLSRRRAGSRVAVS